MECKNTLAISKRKRKQERGSVKIRQCGARPLGAHPSRAAPGARPPSVDRRHRRLCSRFDEKRDSDEANNHQGGTSDEHVTDVISGGARSNRYLVVVSHDRTFVRVHGMLLSWAQNRALLEALRLVVCSDHTHHSWSANLWLLTFIKVGTNEASRSCWSGPLGSSGTFR
jgi:hypothetical protein